VSRRDEPVADGLSHLDPEGRARMVDVSEKPVTERRAVAEGFVRCAAEVLEAIRHRSLAKGDLLNTARLAGVLAAKRTDELIPLCHSLPLDHVDVELTLEEDGVRLRGVALARSRTGVEMEALTAVAVAALTVIDMGKALDRGMVVESIRVVEKTGGRRGPWRAPDAPVTVVPTDPSGTDATGAQSPALPDAPRGPPDTLPPPPDDSPPQPGEVE
jgi:cyclic pyranopterin monophosphate synthase